MGRNWAIAIGINEYQNMRPLRYAQRDAESVCQFFQDELKFHQVNLFAQGAEDVRYDDGPAIPADPTFGNLDAFFYARFEREFLEPGDNLWFFFAGHGKRHQGRDYIMPRDGNPNRVARTAIPIAEIAERLRRSGADNVILMIDACRGEDDRDSGDGVGREEQKGVITFFACSPNKSSYEIEELEQGSFTHALLSAFKIQGAGNCATVERLDQHLRRSVPELNRQYRKPAQNPFTRIEPLSKSHLILLPSQATLADVSKMKSDAQEAELDNELDRAEHLWTRVLAVSPADSQAIKRLQRIAVKRSTQDQRTPVQRIAVDREIEVIPRVSSIRLIPSFDKGIIEQDLLIIPNPERIARQWNIPPRHIVIQGEISLATLQENEVRGSGQHDQWGVRCLLEQDIFQQNFAFITEEDALPGGILPKNFSAQTEVYEGRAITLLLPISPVIVDYLTSEDLVENLQIRYRTTDSGVYIEFILDLPVSGISGVPATSRYRVRREYALEESIAIAELPVLEIWPNFRASNWKEYYGFLWSDTSKAFQISFPKASINRAFKGIGSIHLPNISIADTDSDCQLARMEEFPCYLETRDSQQQNLGLILLKTPHEVQPIVGIPWLVGVDFSPYLTNIYVHQGGTVQQLHIEPLHHQVTNSNREKRLIAMTEYFIPYTMDMPLETILTTRGVVGEDQEIIDGRIYVPRDSGSFKPHTDNWIRTTLKWSPEGLKFNRLFLKQLILQVTALAVANNAAELTWAVSYPSTFSKVERLTYAKIWKIMASEAQRISGINQVAPSEENPKIYRSKDVAFAQYFMDYECLDLLNSACININRVTSEISIWKENELVHQCSVQLTEKDLFSQYMLMNPAFLKRHFLDTDDWIQLRGFQFFLKLDTWTRYNSEGWLSHRRALVGDDPEFRGLLRLMSLGISGLYYYIGLILKALALENKFNATEFTPILIGGNGARLMNWLSEDGEFSSYCEFNDVFNAMIVLASGEAELTTQTHVSARPHDEVAYGLVSGNEYLTGLKPLFDKSIFMGENIRINGQKISWYESLPLSTEIDQVAVLNLNQLQKFMNGFHKSIKSLRIEAISGFPEYNLSEDIQNNEKLWRLVQRDLKKSLLMMTSRTDDIQIEPPFILGLKSLLRVLGLQWADEWKRT